MIEINNELINCMNEDELRNALRHVLDIAQLLDKRVVILEEQNFYQEKVYQYTDRSESLRYRIEKREKDFNDLITKELYKAYNINAKNESGHSWVEQYLYDCWRGNENDK